MIKSQREKQQPAEAVPYGARAHGLTLHRKFVNSRLLVRVKLTARFLLKRVLSLQNEAFRFFYKEGQKKI